MQKQKNNKKEDKFQHNFNSLKNSIDDINPITKNQEIAFDYFDDGYNLMLHGLAGTGKTFISLCLSLYEIFHNKEDYKKVIIVRNVVPTREVGFLPGSLREKIKQYEHPYINACKELFKRSDAYEILKSKNMIEFTSTSFIRGLTFDNCIVIVDEMQNMNFHELDSLITRAGENCRFIFSGDITQSDLTRNDITLFFDIIKTLQSFKFVEFTVDDIVRSGLVRDYIIKKQQLQSNKKI